MNPTRRLVPAALVLSTLLAGSAFAGPTFAAPQAAHKEGLIKSTWHSLRTGFSTLKTHFAERRAVAGPNAIIRAGVAVKTVAKEVGHATMDLTKEAYAGAKTGMKNGVSAVADSAMTLTVSTVEGGKEVTRKTIAGAKNLKDITIVNAKIGIAVAADAIAKPVAAVAAKYEATKEYRAQGQDVEKWLGQANNINAKSFHAAANMEAGLNGIKITESSLKAAKMTANTRTVANAIAGNGGQKPSVARMKAWIEVGQLDGNDPTIASYIAKKRR